MKDWFMEWFDTKYYNALYKERDVKEAGFFIKELIRELSLEKNARILDIACGNGRHAIALNELGFDVTGVDLSFKRIADLQQFQNTLLHFYRHDMRHLFRINYFDCVFNFFTSFGYFDSHHDEKNVAYGMAANLKWGGYLVIDYLNEGFLRNNLIPHEEFNQDEYSFVIDRHFEKDRISKKIRIIENEKESVFYEKVRLYSLKQLIDLFANFQLVPEKTYGSYQMDEYNADESERMIVIFKKLNN